MKISELYRALCKLYDIQVIADIDRFIIGAYRGAYDISIGSGSSEREALFLRQSGDCLELGLFIAPEVLNALNTAEPMDHPDELCVAIEGVSHFLYVCDRAEKKMKVTRLELELQAEVDKFIILQLFSLREPESARADLFSMQFEKHRFDPKLSAEDMKRYETASRLAAKYCHFLLSNLFNPFRYDDLLAESRDFFHRNLAQKIERLTP